MIHYKYGGSTAARQLACPSWRELAKDMPKGAESSYAAEGTRLHDLMENVLEGTIAEPAGEELANMALEAWDDLCKSENIVDYETEQTFQISPEIGGTADVVAWSDDTVYIIDWKFGQGVKVQAENSAQGMFYAMCAEFERPELFKDRDLVVAIIQPMPSRGEETLSQWRVPRDIFELFKRTYMKAVKSKGYQAGAHCQFCPSAPVCPIKTGQAQAALVADPTKLAVAAANLKLVSDLKTWIKEVEQFAHEQLEQGAVIEGWKLVNKRGTRKWTDPDKVLHMLKSKRGIVTKMFMEPAKLMSPAKLEKNIDMSAISAYISSSSSGTTLAPESDKREAVLSGKALKSALDRI